jgi:hypothetical protein
LEKWPMPDKVITRIDQVTNAWLTSVLIKSGALINGEVATFDVKAGQGNWSTNVRLNVKYVKGSQGVLPQRLFLKMVNAHLKDGSFSPSEVYYYTRDFVDVESAPLVHCYDAAFSEKLQRYHVLLDDLSETHITAEEKTPTLEYGLALAGGLAALHSRWWGAQRFTELGATMHSAEHIRHFVDISQSGFENILNHFLFKLEPHWPDIIRTLYARHPQTIIKRTGDDRGFTLVHGDVGHKNILVPRAGDQPIYIIDRQPFDWALTTWLGVYDLAYAMVLDWEIETRRHLEIPILRSYHDQLIKHGINDYSWEQLYNDYKLCVAMSVYVATEYFRSGVESPWVSTWLLMLRRALTACEDLSCSELW